MKITKVFKRHLLIGLSLLLFLSTQVYGKEYQRYQINDTCGFLNRWGRLSNKNDTVGYSKLSTKMYDSLSTKERDTLAKIRLKIPWPDVNTVFQKVITEQDTKKYYALDSSGKIGGFIAVAADVKSLDSSYKIIDGLRLDYQNSPFHKDSSYVVIRFKLPKDSINQLLRIPCRDTAGYSGKSIKDTSPPPYTGTGFTGSSLGKGGFPEYKLTGRCLPEGGAEVYIVDKNGKETLKTIYCKNDKKWK